MGKTASSSLGARLAPGVSDVLVLGEGPLEPAEAFVEQLGHDDDEEEEEDQESGFTTCPSQPNVGALTLVDGKFLRLLCVSHLKTD